MHFFRDCSSPPTPSGTSSSGGKLDDEDEVETNTTDECDSKGNKDEAVQVLDEADAARLEEESKEKQRSQIETWERTLPGSGRVLFYWFILMGGLRRLDQSAVRTHFYPEGGWGWIVCACAFLAHVTTSGAQLSAGALHIVLSNKFQDSSAHHWLGPLSWSVSSVCSPLVFNLCRRKNVRILSLVGGFLFPLSLLFTSFATELHQIFFSFGLVGGIGSCIVRESSGVVLGEYFRRRRQFVEQVVMAGTGVGVTLFSLLYLSFSRHLEWSQGFRIGAGLSTICVLLPAFYRTANQYNPNNRAQLKQNQRQPASPKSQRVSSILVPLGGDICHSLNLFCVPSLKPVLWAASISSFGLYAPVFLMSDFGRSEGLSGGSLLLLQTHLGLGLSLGVILGAILTLKKFQCCHVSPRMLCCCTCVLTGLSMIAISSVKGYYGYSLSAWIYGIALGSHLYTLKVLLMELTRTKHWGRVWSCVQSLMSPGILIGSGVTSYLGKPGFYACATCVLIGAGLIGFQLIDLTKCGSPQLSSSMDNDSPIPPAPPPISPTKYGTPTALSHHAVGGGASVIASAGGYPSSAGGMYPLRRSISLQQPLYPCCRGESGLGDYPPLGSGGAPYTPVLGMHHPTSYSPYCRECLMTPPPYGPTPPPMFPQMIRSYSLPQTAPLSDSTSNLRLKTTGTQTNPNSPVHSPSPAGYARMQPYSGSFDRIHAAVAVAAAQAGASRASGGFVLPEDRVIRDPPSTSKSPRGAQKSTLAAGGVPPSSLSVKPPAISQQPTDTLRKFQPGYKSSVMFASNPQLFPASSSATSTTEERSSSRGGFDVSTTPTPTPQQQQQPPTTPNHSAHLNGTGGVNGANQRYLFNQHHHHLHGSSRDYYPQREERRATFLRSQQHNVHQQQQMSFDSQKSADSSSIFPAQHHHPSHHHRQPLHPPVSRFSVAVEQHKRPIQHQKSQESIQMERSPLKPPPPQTQKPSSSHSQPAFTRHYFDSSKILPAAKKKMMQHHHQKGAATPTISAQVHHQQQQRQPQKPHYYPRWTQPQVPMSVAKQFDPFADDPDPPYYPAALSHAQTHAYHRGGTPVKVSSAEFNIEPPKFNSLRRPGTAQSGSIGGGGDTTRGSSISSQLNLASGGGLGNIQPQPQQHHHPMHQPYLPPAPIVHPSYTPSRVRHYPPGAVPVYPPLPYHHHPQHPPQLQQRHPLLHHHQQQHRPPSSKNVSSAPSFTKNIQKTGQQSQQPPLHSLVHQPKSQQSNNGDGDDDDVEVDVDDIAVSTSKKNSRDDLSRDNLLGGPTIINLPPTIISGASPCPYCDVRRPQSSLSETGGSSGGGRYHRYYRYHQPRLIPGYSLSLSVPALQHIYPSATPTRRHYCSPPSAYALYDIRRRKEFAVPPPPHKRVLRRSNTWHVPKDYLEQITTSV